MNPVPSATSTPKRPICTTPLRTVDVHQRRYLGNKKRVVDWIVRTLEQEVGEIETFCDIFAGSGVVGCEFNSLGARVIANDLLYSNVVCLEAWLGSHPIRTQVVRESLARLSEIVGTENYVSEHFGNRYFTIESAARIGAIRQEIETLNLLPRERSVMLAALLYAMDKVANTVGHYDAYREALDTLNPLELRLPNVPLNEGKGNVVFNRDANELVREVRCDVLYMDPPYNSRQYADAYHVLENVIRWEQPPVFGKTRKFDRTRLKSRFNSRRAAEALEDLVAHANCNHIALSYNNMAKSGHSRSNARISDEDILRILGSRGSVKVFEQEHKAFTAGRSERSGNLERLFFVEVSRG